MIKKLLLGLLLFATPVAAQTISPNFNGLSPGGAAGGSLSGTYPNPSLAAINSIGTSLAIGGCTIGTDKLCANGTASFGSTSVAGTLTATKVAVGGATIGTNALAVTGTSLFNNALDVTGLSVFRTGIQIGNNTGILNFTGNGMLAVGPTQTTTYLPGSGGAINQLGSPDAAVALAQTLRVQSVVAGTAAANGANWTLIGSLPTGTGTSGDIIFQTGVKTGSGTTQGTPTTALTIKGETQTVAVANNVTINGATLTGEALAATGSGKFSTTLAVGGASLGSFALSSPSAVLTKTTGGTLLDVTNATDVNFDVVLTAAGAGTKSTTIGPTTSTIMILTGTGIYTNNATTMLGSKVTITGGATGNVPTLTAGPVTGNPTKWLPYDDNGVTRFIPAW